MLPEDRAIILASNQARIDFPEYECGPIVQSSYQDQCWYLQLRLYKRSIRESKDCWYGVYWANDAWIATLFDEVPRRMQRPCIF